MKALYNFVEAETGFEIGNLNQLDLAVCPRVGEMVAFAADGLTGEATFTVVNVRHILHRDLDREWTQIIDVSVTPVTTDSGRVKVRTLTDDEAAKRYGQA